MKFAFSQFKDRLPSLAWDKQTLADKLSLIGHETEIYGETLDVTLTSNRKDCKDLNYLLFDLAGVCGLEVTDPPSGYGHGPEIVVTAEKINKVLGSNIDQPKVKELERLGFIVTETGVQPPDFRDVATVADVAEEIFRIIGCDALTVIPLSDEPAPESAEFSRLQSIKFALVNTGWTETATYSFAADGQVELNNPFRREEPYLRPNLQNGLLLTLAKNPFIKRGRFFEIGAVFTPEESIKLGLIIGGYKDPTAVTAELESALALKIDWQPIDPAVALKLEAKPGNIMFAEIDLADLKLQTNPPPICVEQPIPKFRPISKFPPLVRDKTVQKSGSEIDSTLRAAADHFPQLLLAEIIDEYINPETKLTSTTIRFIFQKLESSFTQVEIDQLSAELENFLQ